MDRLRGWIGKMNVAQGEAIWFPRCNSVHTWMMSIPIDVVFIKRIDQENRDKNGPPKYRVTSVFSDVRSWKLFPLLDLKADDTMELEAGSIRRLGLAKGDELCLS